MKLEASSSRFNEGSATKALGEGLDRASEVDLRALQSRGNSTVPLANERPFLNEENFGKPGP